MATATARRKGAGALGQQAATAGPRMPREPMEAFTVHEPGACQLPDKAQPPGKITKEQWESAALALKHGKVLGYFVGEPPGSDGDLHVQMISYASSVIPFRLQFAYDAVQDWLWIWAAPEAQSPEHRADDGAQAEQAVSVGLGELGALLYHVDGRRTQAAGEILCSLMDFAAVVQEDGTHEDCGEAAVALLRIVKRIAEREEEETKAGKTA